MTLEELLGKPVWQMTGEELLFLARHGSQPNNMTTESSPSKEQRRYVYGLSGIARLFGCSLSLRREASKGLQISLQNIDNRCKTKVLQRLFFVYTPIC